jgi:hypothetical protein
MRSTQKYEASGYVTKISIKKKKNLLNFKLKNICN